MQKLIFTLALICWVCCQLNAQQVISSGGGYLEGNNYTVSWTLGETVITTLSSESLILTQGFQQSGLLILSVSQPDAGNVSITAFPNPTSDIVNIAIEPLLSDNIRFKLRNMHNQIVSTGKIDAPASTISLNALPRGVYFISVTDSERVLSTIKLIKQ